MHGIAARGRFARHQCAGPRLVDDSPRAHSAESRMRMRTPPVWRAESHPTNVRPTQAGLRNRIPRASRACSKIWRHARKRPPARSEHPSPKRDIPADPSTPRRKQGKGAPSDGRAGAARSRENRLRDHRLVRFSPRAKPALPPDGADDPTSPSRLAGRTAQRAPPAWRGGRPTRSLPPGGADGQRGPSRWTRRTTPRSST